MGGVPYVHNCTGVCAEAGGRRPQAAVPGRPAVGPCAAVHRCSAGRARGRLGHDRDRLSGIRGVASLADAGSSTITVVAYRETADGFDLADRRPSPAVGRMTSHSRLAAARSPTERRLPLVLLRRRSVPAGRRLVDGQAAVLSAVTLVRTTPGTVIGKVVGGDGRPLAGVAVHASNRRGCADTVTDAEGEWVLDNLASEIGWQLEYHGRRPRRVRGLRLPRGGRHDRCGQRRAHAARLGHRHHPRRRRDGHSRRRRLPRAEHLGDDPTEAATVADGTYSFADVVPGRYRIRVEADGHPGTYYPGVDSFADATTGLGHRVGHNRRS